MIKDVINTVKYAKEKGSFKFRDKMDKGEALEREVFDILSDEIEGPKKILVDLLLPNKVGGTTQVDLMLIHRTGIYVIECKNYNAIVSGGIDDEEWSVKYKRGKVYSMYNPIKQNAGHIDKVMNIVSGYKKSVYKSVVIFSENTELDGCRVHKVVRGCKTIVTTADKFKKNVKGINEAKALIHPKDIKILYKLLSNYARSSKRAKQKHNNYVARVQNAKG